MGLAILQIDGFVIKNALTDRQCSVVRRIPEDIDPKETNVNINKFGLDKKNCYASFTQS